MELMNQARGYAYFLGVLKNQQSDPFCRSCSAFANTLAACKENIVKFETENRESLQNLPDARFSRLFAEAKSGITSLKQPENPAGQKKAGNCKMPEGVCFIKTSFAILQKI
jgi:hypothetical protein